jgi:hypothetical protein
MALHVALDAAAHVVDLAEHLLDDVTHVVGDLLHDAERILEHVPDQVRDGYPQLVRRPTNRVVERLRDAGVEHPLLALLPAGLLLVLRALAATLRAALLSFLLASATLLLPLVEVFTTHVSHCNTL